ncbi:Hypothetical protein Y17_2926 [Pectobacterium wasabiae CFBP 3304]|nr:Hypothetical protein Y17_2926 [Pectobacterium wasabiae CFBP 3304]
MPKAGFLDLHTFTHVTNSDIINTGIRNGFPLMSDMLVEHTVLMKHAI